MAQAKPARAKQPLKVKRRTCMAPGCGKTFAAYVKRQRYCSGRCRFRAFYWDHKKATGERYTSGRAAKQGRRKTAARRTRRTRPRSARR